MSKFSDHISGRPKLPSFDLLEASSERLVQTYELVVAHVVFGLGETQLEITDGTSRKRDCNRDRGRLRSTRMMEA